MNEPAPKGIRGSLRDAVTFMQSELDHLLDQRAGIRRQIKGLRRLLSNLRMATKPAAKKARKRSRAQLAAAREINHKRREMYDELSRACRIGLMESGGEATPDQIYSLIVRRGSFSFEELEEEPLVAIVRVLSLMARAGEAKCASSDPYSRWQRISGE